MSLSRTLLRWCGAAAATVLTAHAAYLESDYPTSRQSSPPPPRPPPEWPIVRPVPPPPAGHVLADWLRTVEVGAAYRYGGLTVFPLVTHRRARAADVRALDEALGRGWITVREKGSAEVPSLQVRNESNALILLMTGEILAGGKQNRVVREDVLLPPRSDFIEVPVYCVEQNRWSGRTDKFESPASLAHQGLRKRAAGGEAQGEIWREVDAKAGGLGVASPTRNYQAIYEDRDVGRRADELLRHFSGLCRHDTVGAVMASGFSILSCDVFADPDLFARLWPKLCRSYSLEMAHSRDDRSAPWHEERAGGISERDVRRFLDGAARASAFPAYTPGAGRFLRLSGDVTGSVLAWDGELVHAGFFPAGRLVPMGER